MKKIVPKYCEACGDSIEYVNEFHTPEFMKYFKHCRQCRSEIYDGILSPPSEFFIRRGERIRASVNDLL